MAKITYSSLKLKKKEDTKSIKIGESEIEIKQYLSIEDKIDLVDVTLQKSLEERLYNPLKVDMYFHLNLVYLYTNITFTEKQREDEYKLYDILESNGIINAVIAEIPEEEYNFLLEKVEEKIDNELTYNNTITAFISKLVDDLPKDAQKAASILENFELPQYQSVIDFAKAANGGKEIG